MSSKPRRNRRKKRPDQRAVTLTGLWLFQLLLIFLFCSAAYIFWLDHLIRTEFEGKRWSLPARVYARPLELYRGLKINPDDLIRELKLLGYQHEQQVDGPGEYSLAGEALHLFSRTFEFWDGREMSRKVRLDFAGDRIDGLTDAKTREPVPVMRLDPLLIGKIHPEHREDRVLVSYDDIPPVLVNSLVAVEDRNFFGHSGLDPRGILRAMWVNLRKGELVQGGSTLTQQLVKNFFLTQDRTLWRKFNEIFMSVLLEWHYSKPEILTAYINEVYLGQHGALGIHGFGTAAEFYFARPLNELRIDQVALLVGLVKGASFYNPRRHPERAFQRRNLVIEQMQKLGYLDASEAGKASSAPLDIADSPGWSSAKYPDYMDLVRRQLQQDYQSEDLRTEGLRIFTTLDPYIQDVAGSAVARVLSRLEKSRGLSRNPLQASAIITNVATGEILALIGGRDNEIAGFNRALDARRPIGSLIKPVVYLTALSQPDKYNVLSMLRDEPVTVRQPDGKTWKPKNYDNIAHGQVPLHTALEHSYNLATVNLGMKVGIPHVIKTLRLLGINSEVPNYPSVLLGALDLTPFEVTQIYQTLAGNGFTVPLRAIRDVLDKEGRPLQRFAIRIRQSLDSRAIFITNFLLTRVVSNGTARMLSSRFPELLPLAGKTGTTNDLRDSWFAGFGDNILAIIWIGRDDNKPAGLTGAAGALQVWADIMRVLKPAPLSLLPPENVMWIKMINGRRSTDDCPGAITFPYIQPYLPKGEAWCEQSRSPSHAPLSISPWSL
jgi:penicillin-binding protein 1B